MSSYKDFSIKSKLIIAILSILFISLTGFATFILIVNYTHRTENLLNDAKLQTRLIADYSITPLLFSDLSGAKEVLHKLQDIENINSAVIYDQKGELFVSYSRTGANKNFKKKTPRLIDSVQYLKKELIISTPIHHNNQTYGAVVFNVSTLEVPKEILAYAFLLILAMTVILLLSLLLIYKLQNYITLPIINLAKTAQEVCLSEDFTIRAQKVYSDEVGNLYDDFNSMITQIEQRGRERKEAEIISHTYQAHLERLTNELEERVKDRTGELEHSLSDLQSAQVQLVEAEKMSALGNLVAGVAHEVNTPLGISITAASVFKNELKRLKDLLEDNKLSKSALVDFIETIGEADDILIKNLDRAAILVRNFKKISVDQSSEEIREFELNSYILEVISTFKSELRHRPVELKLNLDKEKIYMNSYPGAISQIVVNMLQNSLLHAFELEQEGEISLETHYKEESVMIIFSDNGKGVDDKIAPKIFEPFITTKRNKGGTGLGLNISYNLVVQKLQGTIFLDTDNKKGARFIIEIPLKMVS